jgi:hypothetical protein
MSEEKAQEKVVEPEIESNPDMRKLIIVEVLGKKQYDVKFNNIDVEAIPIVLRRVALDVEKNLMA